MICQCQKVINMKEAETRNHTKQGPMCLFHAVSYALALAVAMLSRRYKHLIR